MGPYTENVDKLIGRNVGWKERNYDTAWGPPTLELTERRPLCVGS